MAKAITNEDWDQLRAEDFESAALLSAVDAVDKIRDHLNDGEDGRPPELRINLLRLHQQAMAVFNQGSRGEVPKMFELAAELDKQVQDLTILLEKVQETLFHLTLLAPESLSSDELDEAEQDGT